MPSSSSAAQSSSSIHLQQPPASCLLLSSFYSKVAVHTVSISEFRTSNWKKRTNKQKTLFKLSFMAKNLHKQNNRLWNVSSVHFLQTPNLIRAQHLCLLSPLLKRLMETEATKNMSPLKTRVLRDKEVIAATGAWPGCRGPSDKALNPLSQNKQGHGKEYEIPPVTNRLQLGAGCSPLSAPASINQQLFLCLSAAEYFMPDIWISFFRGCRRRNIQVAGHMELTPACV